MPLCLPGGNSRQVQGSDYPLTCGAVVVRHHERGGGHAAADAGAVEDVPAQIADALDGAELSLALDATAGQVVADLAAALRFRGAIVSYAYVTDAPPAVRAHDVIFNEVTHTGFWLLNWLRHAPRTEIEQTYHTLNDFVASGELAVPVDAIYRLDDYHEAIDHAMTPGRTGKVLFTPDVHFSRQRSA